MVIPTLEDWTSDLDRVVMDYLGDTIQYKPSGGAYAPLRGYIDYQDMVQSFEGSAAVAQDMTITVLMADLAARPSRNDRLTLPKVPSRTFRPASVRRDESGTHWVFELEDVTNG